MQYTYQDLIVHCIISLMKPLVRILVHIKSSVLIFLANKKVKCFCSARGSHISFSRQWQLFAYKVFTDIMAGLKI